MPINPATFPSNDQSHRCSKLLSAMIVVADAITLVRQMPAAEPGFETESACLT